MADQRRFEAAAAGCFRTGTGHSRVPGIFWEKVDRANIQCEVADVVGVLADKLRDAGNEEPAREAILK
jgi:hypothetical protein